jgi:glycosyltransferase involved in cell wall biosynthesis
MIKSSPKKILFYSDISELGGHEILSINAIRYLLNDGYDVHCICSSYNKKIISLLTDLTKDGLTLYFINYQSTYLPNIKSLLSFKAQKYLCQLCKSINPSLLITMQGRIESSSLPLTIADYFDFPIISYLPLTHSVKTISGKRGARLREIINKILYQKPDYYVVPSNAMKFQLTQRVKGKEIFIIHNGIDFSRYKFIEKYVARDKFKISQEDFVISIIGRVNFRHKNHEFIINNMPKLVNLMPNIKLMIAGSGADEKKLVKIIRSSSCREKIIYTPWLSDVSEVFCASDILVSASRFEGFPVVANEAMYYKLPIIAPDIPEMREFIPKEWLYKPFSNDDFVNTLMKVVNSEKKQLVDHNFSNTIQNFDLNTFGSNFKRIIESIISSS